MKNFDKFGSGSTMPCVIHRVLSSIVRHAQLHCSGFQLCCQSLMIGACYCAPTLLIIPYLYLACNDKHNLVEVRNKFIHGQIYNIQNNTYSWLKISKLKLLMKHWMVWKTRIWMIFGSILKWIIAKRIVKYVKNIL